MIAFVRRGHVEWFIWNNRREWTVEFHLNSTYVVTLTYREIVRERHWWLPAQWDPGVCGRSLGSWHQEFIPDLRYRLILKPLPKSCCHAPLFLRLIIALTFHFSCIVVLINVFFYQNVCIYIYIYIYISYVTATSLKILFFYKFRKLEWQF